MTPSQQAPSLVERQEFEKFPKLAGWIEKLATRKIEGFSLASWCAFLSEINAAIRERSPAQGPAADVIRRLRTPDEFNNRGPDYEPMIIQPSALRLEAADALEEAAARITELEGDLKAAFREISKLAREAGEAKGRLEMSEAAGIVDGWRERAERAEARCRALEEALRPFAEACAHLHPSQPDDGVTLDGFEVRDFRCAAHAFSLPESPSADAGPYPRSHDDQHSDGGRN